MCDLLPYFVCEVFLGNIKKRGSFSSWEIPVFFIPQKSPELLLRVLFFQQYFRHEGRMAIPAGFSESAPGPDYFCTALPVTLRCLPSRKAVRQLAPAGPSSRIKGHLAVAFENVTLARAGRTDSAEKKGIPPAALPVYGPFRRPSGLPSFPAYPCLRPGS